jgi:hypothetical protein
VEDGSFGDESNSVLVDPFPKDDIFCRDVRLDFLFRLDVEDLQLSLRWTRLKFRPKGERKERRRETSTTVRERKLKLQDVHFKAIIFLLGCMIAESAVIGRRITLLASARSIITTWFCSPTFSRTQMKWSDSSVKVCKRVRAMSPFAALEEKIE